MTPPSPNLQIILLVLSNMLTFSIGYLLQRTAPKAKIRVSFLPSPNYTIPPQNENQNALHVKTRVIRIHNKGKIHASDVELIFNYKPFHHSIAPPVNYEQSENPEGNYIIRFPRVGPRQETFVTLLHIGNGELPDLRDVASEFGSAKLENVKINPRPTRIVVAVVATLMLIGSAAIVYGIWLVILWAINAV